MSNFKKFSLTVIVGIIALIMEFVFDQPQLAFWIIAIVGGLMAISMFIGMIQTLKSGKYCHIIGRRILGESDGIDYANRWG